MLQKSPYTAAITGGGFLFEETNVLLPLLQSPDRVDLLKDEKLNNRLLKINAETSRDRAIAEIARRYDAMPASFWVDLLSRYIVLRHVKFVGVSIEQLFYSCFIIIVKVSDYDFGRFSYPCLCLNIFR